MIVSSSMERLVDLASSGPVERSVTCHAASTLRPLIPWRLASALRLS